MPKTPAMRTVTPLSRHRDPEPPDDGSGGFFEGPVRAWGLIQAPDGAVLNRFDILTQGTWTGEDGGWLFAIDVPLGDAQIKACFDDGAWRAHDGVLVNQTSIQTGDGDAEVTIFMKMEG